MRTLLPLPPLVGRWLGGLGDAVLVGWYQEGPRGGGDVRMLKKVKSREKSIFAMFLGNLHIMIPRSDATRSPNTRSGVRLLENSEERRYKERGPK